MLRSLKDLEGYAVSASDGDVGKVVDFLLDDERWGIRYLVVETGDILGGERGLISPISFREADWSTRRFHLALTMDQVENSPSIDLDKPVSRQHERDYFKYYGYPSYSEAAVWGMGLYPGSLLGPDLDAGSLPGPGLDAAPTEQADQPVGDVHLRSAAEVRGYHIQGSDDSIGHVADFVVDDETWEVNYLVVDTSNWLFGRKVLVAPHWASSISWEERKVYVDETREAIRNSPEWHPDAGINHMDEARLHGHYGRPVPRRIADLHGDQMTHLDDKNPVGKDRIASDAVTTEGDSAGDAADAVAPNPPRTTSLGWLTVPKFGSATSGGGEIEPGPERD